MVTNENRQPSGPREAQEAPVDHVRSAPAGADGESESSCAKATARRVSWTGPATTPSSPRGDQRRIVEQPPDWRGPHLIRGRDCLGRGTWAWAPQSNSVSLPASRLRIPESWLSDVREVVAEELAKKKGQAEQQAGLTEELTKLREELACQKQELQTQRTQIDFQREQMETLAAQAQDWQDKARQTSTEERAALITEVRSACIDLVSSLAARVRDLIHAERENRSVALCEVRESVQFMLEDRIRRQCREERMARLEELSEMQSALLNRLDEERASLQENMRGLALAIKLGFKNGPVVDHEDMPSAEAQIPNRATKGSLAPLLHGDVGGLLPCLIATPQFNGIRSGRSPQDTSRVAVVQDAVEQVADKSLLCSELAPGIPSMRNSKTDDNPSAGLPNDRKETHEQSDSAGDMTRSLAGSPGDHCGSRSTLGHAKQNANEVESSSCEQQLQVMMGTRRAEGTLASRLESIAEEKQLEATGLDNQGERYDE